jgi:glycine cleavage system H lipoate-binding protein
MIFQKTTFILKNKLREITYFYPEKEGSRVKRMGAACRIESEKCVCEILSLLSGVVLKFNDKLFDDPHIINQAPCGRGRITIVRPANLDEDLEAPLKPDVYADRIRELIKIDDRLLIHRWKKEA